jgi:hypothetical protein
MGIPEKSNIKGGFSASHAPPLLPFEKVFTYFYLTFII